MRKALSSISLLFITAFVFAQQQVDFNNFSPLLSSGTLPSEVEMTAKDFIASSRDDVMNSGPKKEKKTKKQFLLESSYSIKELFISGRILFNDPISDYIEKVRLKITTPDAALQAETRVFVIKSSVVNAFATNQGYIFITTGLLSQLENEAQLAFILSHELMHYKKKHVLNGYIENERINRGEGAYRKSTIDKKYLDKANYSRESESEADVAGFELFLQSGYALEATDGVFDVLKYADLPFDEVVFSQSLLETDYLKFPVDYIEEEIEAPEGEDEEKDDKFSTHPNLKTRREDIKDAIDRLDAAEKAKTRQLFLVSEDAFYYTRKLARFDICHTNLIDRDYDMAFYQAYCLLQDDPNSIYLKKVLLKALYGIAKYKNAGRFFEVAKKPKKVEGESQRLNFLLEKMENNELNVVALNYAWRLKKNLNNEDAEVNLITEDLFYEMVRKHYTDKSFFATEARPAIKDSTTINTAEEESSRPKKNKLSNKSDSRVAKIKKKKNVDQSDYFVTYAFVDLLKDSGFVKTYNKITTKVAIDKKAKEEDELLSRRERRKKEKNQKHEPDTTLGNAQVYGMYENNASGRFNEKWDCYALGVKKLLILNPFSLRIDERKKNQELLESSDEAQKKFNKRILDIAGDVKLDVQVLDKKTFTVGSVANYNDMALLIDWLDERIDHKDLAILPTDYLQVADISEKYGSEHIALMGTINFIEKKRGVGYAILASVFLPYFSWPITIPYMIVKKTETYVYTIVLNLKTGQTEMANVGSATLADSRDIVSSFLYDHLKQIKRKGQSKNK